MIKEKYSIGKNLESKRSRKKGKSKRVSFKGYLNRNETKRLFSSQTKKELTLGYHDEVEGEAKLEVSDRKEER